ncbi:lysylphosphatidylglycerol synthase transmembrane domain-containing protein [Promineifilum sp.]|uniref:lysylphosphatidylglycerol synthase transmembrane domain-containing protein n=1 Tax=Promineifilum sp. TaxID=2664178 RepID=UPI0035AF394B
MTRRAFLRLLPWLLGAGLLFLIVQAISFQEVLTIIKRLRLWQIAVLVAANGFVLLTLAGRWWVLLRGQGYRVPFGLLLGYRLAVFGLSYFTPGPHVGGEPLQVLLVEREQGVPRSAALAAVALDKAIEFSVNFAFLLLGIAAVLRWRIVPQQAGQQALGLAAALLFMPLLYLGVTGRGYYPATRAARRMAGLPFLHRAAPRLSAAAATLEESERQVGRFAARAPWAFAAAIAVTLVSWAALIGEYWLMVNFLGVRLTLPQLVTAITAARIAILLLLPAGLGALELSQTLAYGALGLDPAVGLSVSLLIRARDSLVGVFGLWWGSRRVLATNRKKSSR